MIITKDNADEVIALAEELKAGRKLVYTKGSISHETDVIDHSDKGTYSIKPKPREFWLKIYNGEHRDEVHTSYESAKRSCPLIQMAEIIHVVEPSE